MADMGTDKQLLFLVPGDLLTVELAAELLRRLTGTDVSPEGMARLHALFAKKTSESNRGSIRPRVPPPVLMLDAVDDLSHEDIR